MTRSHINGAAPAKGGHSSAPPKETGVETLAKAVLAIAHHPFPLEFKGPGADMVRTVAPHAGWTTRMAVANAWLFGPLLKSQIAQTPAGAATLHTTIAPTMLKGSPKENVLPQDATAWINYRIAPGDTVDGVMERARDDVRGLNVQLVWDGKADNPSPVSATDSDGWKIIAALGSEGGKIPVAPNLVTGATDSHSLIPVSRNIYRYQPILFETHDIEMIHGTNEHLTLDNLTRMVSFYERLIATAAS